LGLKAVLEGLEIPFRHLHVAGNDANFTLKALLMVAVRGTRDANTKLNEDQEELLAKLQAIGQASIDAELSRETPDSEKHHRKVLAQNNEKRNVRLEARKVDLLDHFSGFAGLEIWVQRSGCSSSRAGTITNPAFSNNKATGLSAF
jgi:hypothetical protein